jgi:predicted transcriptional regulator YdeE
VLVDLQLRPTSGAFGVTVTVPSSFAEDAAAAEPMIETAFATLEVLLDGRYPDAPRIGISGPDDDHVPPRRIAFTAAIEVDALGAHLPALDARPISGGTYAVVTYDGPVHGLDDFSVAAYGTALAEHGLATRDGEHLEIRRPCGDPAWRIVEAWIPVTVAT